MLNRAAWSTFAASRILFGLLLSAFDTGGALVFGIDETLERRWGKKIKAKGINGFLMKWDISKQAVTCVAKKLQRF